MADRDYHIDWSADVTPALALLGQSLRAKRDDRRADQNLEFQVLAHEQNMQRSAEKESHERARQADLDKRKRAIEDFNARDALFRTAQRSPEAASQNPYGYSFEARNDLPANVEGPELSPTAEAARFQLAGGPNGKAGVPQQAPIAQPQAGSLMPSEEGPEFDPAAEMARHTVEGPQMQASGYQGGGIDAFGDAERERAAANMDAVGGGLQGPRQVIRIAEPFSIDNTPDASPSGVLPTPEPPQTASAAAHMLGMEPGPEGKRRVFASYQGGDRFELPEQSTTSGFGPKYDAIYQRFLLEPGVTPEEALKAVTKMAHEDAVESGRDTRAERAEDARSQRDAQYRMDIAGQFEQQRRALEQSDKNSRRAAASGGGVNSGALQEFVKAANALKPGDPISPAVADLGVKAGFKGNQIAAEADRYRNSDAKSLKGGAGGILSLKEIGPLNVSINNIDKLIGQIERNPQAWDEYRDAAERWKRNQGMRGNVVGQALQGVGIMNVSPEQGLKTSEGKTLFQRQETLDIDIAKSFGGVITEGDRDSAKAKQANFALNAQEKLAGLKELRDSLVTKRETFLQTNKAGGADAQSAGVRSVRMPDGSVQKFDASGKRVE